MATEGTHQAAVKCTITCKNITEKDEINSQERLIIRVNLFIYIYILTEKYIEFTGFEFEYCVKFVKETNTQFIDY